ncbi:MAG TPA: hypothetical protein VNW46_09015 [Gemmatimonadaceae bacterium]|nr:hypothetical protein [Gemmatimonadaceae bacterium]
MTTPLRVAATLALSASPLAAQTCVAHVDTLRDTIYAVFAPARSTDAVTAAALTPVARKMITPGNVISLGNGPAGPLLDIRTGPHQPLPAKFTALPGPWTFTLHRDGTITRATALDGPFSHVFTTAAVPYPDGLTTDSIALHVSFRIGPDSSLASAPAVVRRIYLLPIKQQAHALPTNPRPTARTTDTAMVQFTVTADGTVDTTTFYPIHAHSQTSIDAIRAILPALHFTPALALNDCPTRTVTSQSFIVRPSPR